MPAGFWKLVRVMCYGALVVALLAVAALVFPFAFDYCRDDGAGQIACDPPILLRTFEAGFSVVMFGAYTGIPAGLAAGGLGFLLIDIVGWFRSA